MSTDTLVKPAPFAPAPGTSEPTLEEEPTAVLTDHVSAADKDAIQREISELIGTGEVPSRAREAEPALSQPELSGTARMASHEREAEPVDPYPSEPAPARTRSIPAPMMETPPAVEAETAGVRPGFARRLLTMPVRVIAVILALLDLPFSFLSGTVKSLIGMLAIGTALMAAAVWIYGPRLATSLPAEPPAISEPGVAGADHGKTAAGSPRADAQGNGKAASHSARH